MEFKCPRARLHEALTVLGNIVPSRSTKPILQNIHIKGTSDNRIMLIATNFDIGVKYEIIVDSLDNPCDILLPCSRFSNIVRDAWGEDITIKVNDNKASIITEKAKFEIMGESAEDFPEIKEIDEDKSIDVLAIEMAKSISKTIFATAKEEERYSLAGVNLSFKENVLDIVTTDTFRIAKSCCLLRKNIEEEKQAIVLDKGMHELLKLLNGEEILKIQITDTHLYAKTSRATMISRLIDGKFPQYDNVIPQNTDIKIKIKKDLFIQGLRQAANLSNEETNAVNISAHDSVLELKSESLTGGESFIEIEAEIIGGEVNATFNYIYLLEVLKVLEGENVILQLKDKESPAKIEEKNYVYVVSPVCPKTNNY